MPNHVSNLIKVKGDMETIRMMLTIVKDDDRPFSLNKVIPMPESLEQGKGWYDWHISHWGTKWDVYEVEIIDSDPFFKREDVDIQFLSAWSPPIQVTRVLSAMFPDLEFTHYYEDEGQCFNPGWTVFKNYDEIEVKEFDPNNDDEFDKWKQLEIFECYEDYKEREEEYRRENA